MQKKKKSIEKLTENNLIDKNHPKDSILLKYAYSNGHNTKEKKK